MLMSTVTLLCCSFEREAALKATLPNKLAVRGVDEVLIVLDGSTDGSEQFLQQYAKSDPRIRVLSVSHRGVQRCRNLGIEEAKGDWILLVDDDDYLAENFVEELSNCIRETGAVLAGAPWLHVSSRAVLQSQVASRRKAAVAELSFRSHPSTFTQGVALTPFLYSMVLIRKDIARRFPYDVGYRGNSWREETDMFLRVAADGGPVVRSNKTYSWMEESFSGGHDKKSRFLYEYRILRNELRFLYLRRRELSLWEPGWKGWMHEYYESVKRRITPLFRAFFRH